MTSPTNTFSAGSPIVASDVNTNFTEIHTELGNKLAIAGGNITGGLTVADNFTVDSNTFFVDSEGNVVGIGTSSPDTSYKLNVDGNTSLVGTVTVGSEDGSGHDVTFYSETAGDHFVWDASEKKLTITGESATDTLVVADGRTKLKDRVWCEATQDVDLSGITGSLIVGGDGTGDHLAFDANEIMAKSDGVTAATLHINNDGGTVKFGNETDLTSFEVNGPATFNDGITGTLTGNVTGDVTGNVSGTAATVTTAAQTAITSVGTLTGLTVSDGSDNATIYLGDSSNTSITGSGSLSSVGFNIDGVSVGTFWEAAGMSLNFDIVGTGTGTDLIIHDDGWIQKKSSSLRYKNVASVNMSDYLTASMVDSLEPKMFSYKSDTENHPMVGFIAEDCDSISPFLAVHNSSSQVETIDKDALIALLAIGLKDARARITALEG